MPLFEIKNNSLITVEPTNFVVEKDLHNLIEQNLESVFDCRLIASEFSTGVEHAGRIDTLALSEQNNPVIIEYKKIESSDLINQSLFYLHWIQDHKGDYEIAVQKALGIEISVDWSNIRVICIAPKYKKYDLHAVQVMGANIELWKYHLFSNNSLYLEEVFLSNVSSSTSNAKSSEKKGNNLEQLKFEDHLLEKDNQVRLVMQHLHEYILNLDSSIKDVVLKSVIAYRTTRSFVWILTRTKNQLKVRLKLDKEDLKSKPKLKYIDSTNKSWAPGNTEFILKKKEDVELLKPYIELAYNKIGG